MAFMMKKISFHVLFKLQNDIKSEILQKYQKSTTFDHSHPLIVYPVISNIRGFDFIFPV